MQAACDTAFAYAHERKQFETRIGEFQLIQGKVRHFEYFLDKNRIYIIHYALCLDAFVDFE